MKKNFLKFSLLTLIGVSTFSMYSCAKSQEFLQSSFTELIEDEDKDEDIRSTNHSDISLSLQSEEENDEVEEVQINHDADVEEPNQQEDEEPGDDEDQDDPVDPEDPEPEPDPDPEPVPDPEPEPEPEPEEEAPTLYTLTFVVDGVETVHELEEGSEINYPENPVKEEYHFIGWDKEIDVMPAENVVITAQFKEVVHGGFSYTNSQGNEVTYTWEDLVENEYIEVTKSTSGKVILDRAHLYEFGDFDGTLVVDDSITSINSLAGNTNLEKVIIPDSVTEIGWNLFSGDTNLKEVEFGTGITTFSKYMFDGCTSLENFDIPSNITLLDEGCFRGCTSLTSMVIPETVQDTGWSIFQGCSSLEDVRIDANISTIQNSSFRDCVSLTSFETEYPITCIKEYAFFNCINLDPNYIIRDVIECEQRAFDFDKELYSRNIDAYVIPSSATKFTGMAFGYGRDDCYMRPMYYNGTISNLLRGPRVVGTTQALFYLATEVRILDENGEYQYKGKNYSKITKIEVPRDITRIERKVLSNLNDVTDIYIHKDFEAFGGQVFFNLNTAQVKVHYEGTEEEWANVVKTEKSGKVTLNNIQMDLNNVEFNTVLNY